MCIWKNESVEILDVPEDQPIVAYKYLRRAFFDRNVLISPNWGNSKWVLGEKVSSRTKDPLMSVKGVKVGFYAFAAKRAAQSLVGLADDRVLVKIHLWGKVAVHAGEPYDRGYIRMRVRNDTSGRFKGYRAQHAKLVKVYE